MTREFERPKREWKANPGEAPESATPLRRRPRLLPFGSVRSGEGQAWMVTFTDLVALMLTFFVMMFAMMKVDERVWQGLTASLSERLDAFEGPTVAEPRYAKDSEATPLLPGTDLDYLQALIDARLAERADSGSFRIVQGERGLIVRLPYRLAFAPGDAEPRASASLAVAALAETLRNLDNRVELAGYSGLDDPAAPFASAWELSLARAVAVAEVLRNAGYPQPVTVRGYGAVAAGQAGDRAAGGRVDLVIRADAGDEP